MENKICLDTDFLVNFLRNKEAEKKFILENESSVLLATTFINIFELYYGAYKSNKEKNILQVEELHSRLKVLNLSKAGMKEAGEVLAELEKKGEKIDFRDLLIGCTARSEGYCVKTLNVKHFSKIKNLKIM